MVTVIWSGLAVGAIYASVALQINIVFIATGVFNFAQAQIVMLASFAFYFFGVTLGLPTIADVVLSCIAAAAVAVLEEIAAIRPLVRSHRKRSNTQHAELVTTIGAAYVMEGAALVIWGDEARPVPFRGPSSAISVLGGNVLPVELVLIAVGLALGLFTWLLLAKTRFGLAARATAEDRDAAMLRGVNTSHVSIFAFAISGAAAGACAIVVAPVSYAVFNFGDSIVLLAFVALAIAGFGSVAGAVGGGLLVGLVESFAERYLGTNWGLIVIFALLLAVLSVRPRGLFGQSATRAV